MFSETGTDDKIIRVSRLIDGKHFVFGDVVQKVVGVIDTADYNEVTVAYTNAGGGDIDFATIDLTEYTFFASLAGAEAFLKGDEGDEAAEAEEAA